MSRQGNIKKRVTQPDLRYGSVLVAKIINRAMLSGKKSPIEKQVYAALEILGKETGKEPLAVLNQAMDNLKPQMEVRPRRIGGAAYQVPMPVRGDRSEALGVRWLIIAARKRPSSQYHSFAAKLAAEVLDILKNEGGAMKKKMDIHRMAESNKAFAHFRW
ncbi:30S ribosomal protein S7 [Candidatus Shapirobacteria bacterium CG08_land_8_20_14_0_20_39_18]|uniref:Small ribosomal subunit protein uS7 n=1 Tax=Candidatus Shapirobacteria bacterium CG08_land_8_20_14_0_20_39_18 TaxID=1974883 RepID=A0A2M6XC85_9BACT|nr:MAG: 30S ribosomal protein S7 [Candidatus Shapirobacteria bacterium CG08_land_8_20_14_0_20_39_18]PIY66385.1 MAG: 30S ribosomal protein S7 [Candidatus Shapirobacteria bacterium CG_4_10_14_0_8_um_filter_39_15]PJE68315.1 MAG: 30S ribosomal protein S7 [Candidatus Shapirobacteria bacterium CG10_big_fil_rev_8_21_14_0_10_38_8]